MRAVCVIAPVGALITAEAACAEPSVVWGRATNQALLPNDLGRGPNTDPICISHEVYVWTLSIQKTLSGPEVSGKVVAWRRQRFELPRAEQRAYSNFVLEPIANADERRNMRADYWLRDMSRPHYCLDVDPSVLGVDASVVRVEPHSYGDVYCFPFEPPR